MSETLRLEGLRGELRFDEPMSRHVSWRTGGHATRCYVPADLDDLCRFLAQTEAGEPLLFVGLGSNLLVRDGGYRGTVILVHAASKHPVLLDGDVYAECGVASPKVARFAARHGFTGAEFLAGIPGTVGGALAMNAGCYGAETWDIAQRVVLVERRGVLRTCSHNDFDLGYRHCALRSGGILGTDCWFAAAYFRLPQGNEQQSRARIRELLTRRIATQPLQLPNAGSVFRNPIGDHAARLIESCGLKGLERGGARVSEKHANFIVNPRGAARAADIEWLINTVRDTVVTRAGVTLHPEVRIVGEAAS